ncbi:general substrate transporter [Aureobasidium pullulans]|uniref:General substrate transporter n=1 Tax=Aureobasidium pullulans TaxID=5580 RepID=A0A4S9F9V8_AURPU|nr:general substrate transporter [Aureobasidium pullulans]
MHSGEALVHMSPGRNGDATDWRNNPIPCDIFSVRDKRETTFRWRLSRTGLGSPDGQNFDYQKEHGLPTTPYHGLCRPGVAWGRKIRGDIVPFREERLDLQYLTRPALLLGISFFVHLRINLAEHHDPITGLLRPRPFLGQHLDRSTQAQLCLLPAAFTTATMGKFSMSKTRAYNWYISLVAASCMVLYGYDASVFNAVQGSKHWVAYFDKPSLQTIGAINTAYTVGAIVAGWFMGGPIADYFGRRVGMASGATLVIIATFIQTFTPRHNLACYIVGRVVVGLGQGLALTAGPIYIGELAPSEIRGKIMSFWQMFYSVGSFIAYWVNFACSKHRAELGEWDWRMVTIFQLLMPVLILSQVFFIPETPRWYLQHGDDGTKAKQSLMKVRDTEQEVDDEILMIKEALEFEKEAISSSYSALWKDPSVRKRLLLAFVLNAGQQITGQGTLNTYSTIIYKKVFASDSTIALINALNATFAIFFTMNATWTVDRFGRKFLLIIGALGMAMCMVIVAAVVTETPGGNTKSEPVGIAVVFLLFLFAFFYKPSWGATVWIWTAEIFSMNVRAQAVGMASQTQNVANLIVQQFFPTFLNNCGFYAFYMFAGINLLLAVFVWFCIPETKNVTLEEIDTLFGGQNHVEKGGDMMGVIDARHAEGEKFGVEHIDEIREDRR